MITKKLFLLFGLMFMVFSCKTHKVVTQSETEDLNTKRIIGHAVSSVPMFTHLTIQSKVNADIDGISTTANATIFVDNGNKIWANVTKFGITGARALITPEGFKAYEKIGKSYYDSDFTFFNNLLKVDFIDYGKLQNLLLGRTFVALSEKEFTSLITGENYMLNHINNTKKKESLHEGQYIQTYTFDSGFRLLKAHLKDPNRDMEVVVDYENWIKAGNEEFPKKVKVLVKDGKKEQQAEIEYTTFTFKSMDTPFSIPSGYKKKEIRK